MKQVAHFVLVIYETVFFFQTKHIVHTVFFSDVKMGGKFEIFFFVNPKIEIGFMQINCICETKLNVIRWTSFIPLKCDQTWILLNLNLSQGQMVDNRCPRIIIHQYTRIILEIVRWISHPDCSPNLTLIFLIEI